MNLIQRHTCSLFQNRACKAIEGYGATHKYCSLGFSTRMNSKPFKMIPLEPCPKPMTNDELVEAYSSNKFRKQRKG